MTPRALSQTMGHRPKCPTFTELRNCSMKLVSNNNYCLKKLAHWLMCISSSSQHAYYHVIIGLWLYFISCDYIIILLHVSSHACCIVGDLTSSIAYFLYRYSADRPTALFNWWHIFATWAIPTLRSKYYQCITRKSSQRRLLVQQPAAVAGVKEYKRRTAR
jgi:hypothetical protein